MLAISYAVYVHMQVVALLVYAGMLSNTISSKKKNDSLTASPVYSLKKLFQKLTFIVLSHLREHPKIQIQLCVVNNTFVGMLNSL